jgi:protein-tyrosine phosphatase
MPRRVKFFGLVNRIARRANEPLFQKGHIMMDVSRITDQIYVGTNACCIAHYSKLLIQKGVTHDVSLEGERVDHPYGVDSYLWLPTPDHTAPTMMNLDLGVSYIDTVLHRGGSVFIHCMNGHGRAPTLAAAWFIKEGMSVVDAVALLKQKRPEVHIEPAQMRMLASWRRARSSRTGR